MEVRNGETDLQDLPVSNTGLSWGSRAKPTCSAQGAVFKLEEKGEMLPDSKSSSNWESLYCGWKSQEYLLSSSKRNPQNAVFLGLLHHSSCVLFVVDSDVTAAGTGTEHGPSLLPVPGAAPASTSFTAHSWVLCFQEKTLFLATDTWKNAGQRDFRCSGHEGPLHE